MNIYLFIIIIIIIIIIIYLIGEHFVIIDIINVIIA